MNLLQTTNVETASIEEIHAVLLDAATCYASAFALTGINKSAQGKLNAKIAKKTKSEAGLKAANARLDQKGGYRETTAKIRNEWATGNYAGRDECATLLAKSFSVSFDKARKALKNTPNPDPWPAKKKRSWP